MLAREIEIEKRKLAKWSRGGCAVSWSLFQNALTLQVPMRTRIFHLNRFMLRRQILKYRIKFSIAYKERFQHQSMLLLVNYSIHFQTRISIASFYLSIYLDLSFSFSTLKFRVTTSRQISNTTKYITIQILHSIEKEEAPKIQHTLFYRRRSPVRLCASMPTHLLQRPPSQ